MRSSRNFIALSAIAVFCFACALALGSHLNGWADDTVAGSVMEAALFRLMALPAGPVLARRPPAESVPQVTAVIERSPEKSGLYAIRAQEEERALNFAAAESDWKKTVSLSSSKASTWVDLADFYHRRLKPAEEVEALLHAARIAPEGLDRFRSASAQPASIELSRAIDVAKEAALPPAAHQQIYQAWIVAYPNSEIPYRRYMDFLTEEKNRDGARALQAQIAFSFPSDLAFQIESEAKFAGIDGERDAELDVYSRRFTPLWPAELRTRYYELLKGAHQLRTFLANARADSVAHPAALEPVLRMYFYYESEGNRDAADAELLGWQARRTATGSPASANELLTVGPLFERVADYDESARACYALYEMTSAAPSEKEEALSRLISLLLDVPEQPLALGRRDLSLYRNIAQMDRHPGFLNGILSLALNSTSPQYEYANASQTAATYFHRASAARFLEQMRQQFPNSSRTGALETKLFGAYAAYGQKDALIRLVPTWLVHNEASPGYVSTALALGDAYAARQRTADEFALYDDLLSKLASKSEHVPLGPELADEETQPARVDSNESNTLPAPLARSSDYARVLDRYLSRLTGAQRLPDALALYRREIQRNPDDPGLYKRLALFVEQNRLDAQLAEIYRTAFDRFKTVSWADKLARLYLRRKQLSAYQALDRQVTQAFSGTELAGYVTVVAPDPKINPVLYRQINLYAHVRFPHNLTFVRNLLNAYENKPTADPAAYSRLLRDNWFYDTGLRTTFFEYLSRTGRLQAELSALPAVDAAARTQNVAAIQMRGEGLAWLTRFESAAPALAKVAELTPGDRGATDRAISVERSLASAASGAFDTALALAEQDAKAAPRDTAALTRVGEIYADRDDYSKATPWWDRIAKVNPGSANGYLEAATIFWDYFQYGDALRMIGEARQTGKQPARFAYEAGAIYENQGNFSRAVGEYLAAALEDPPTGANASARDRLLQLAKRKATAQLVEERSAYLTSGKFDSKAFALRIALLKNQGRTADIHSLLNGELARIDSLPQAEEIKNSAERFGFDDTATRALERTVALTTDPVEKIKARVDLAVLRENHNDSSGAERDFAGLLQDDPELLGVIRSAVDFYWREKKYGKAVSTLAAAASGAQQPYRDQLRREAAQKASNSGDYATARNLLDQLLASDPLNGNLLAQKAEIYAAAKDNRGLLQFYTDELKAFESAALSPQEQNGRIAELRRGYVPALITAGQFDAALEQYEQLLNQYADDASLASEAALFAQKHQLGDRLLAFYNKAAADSPRNYRWPLLLARIHTALGQYADAIGTYNKAAYVRPDRTDILTAEADLELRTLHFAEATETNKKLYELSYHDSRYLLELATLSARLGNHSEALRQLRAAYVDAHPNEPSGYLPVMTQLSGWQMFEEVDRVYKQVRPMLRQGSNSAAEIVRLEAQALTSLHRPADAIAAVTEAWSGVKGLSGQAPAYSTAVGAAAKDYLTPDEKSKFAEQISTPAGLPVPFNRYEVANAAGFLNIAGDALTKKLQAEPPYLWSGLQELQTSRLAFEPLGQQLELIARSAKDENLREQILRGSLEAYRKAGDAAAQLRLSTSRVWGRRLPLSPSSFAELYIAAGPDLLARLAALSKRNPKYADAVVEYLVANRPLGEALSGIQTRGALLRAPWTAAYTALAGLYFLSPEPSVPAAFDSVLGPRTIAAELASLHSNAAEALRGDAWFYYAARYGDYLSYRNQDAAELLPATVESAPAASNSYLTLGDTYRDRNQSARALSLYEDALQLSPARADIHDRIAILLVHSGRRQEAAQQWREAFRLLADRVEQGPLAPDYWQTAQNILTHINQARLTDELHADAETMLLAYIKRNDGYNLRPFAEGMLAHAPDRIRALNWIFQLARQTNTNSLATELRNSRWLSLEQREPLYRFAVDRAGAQLNASAGEAANSAREQLTQAQIDYVTYLLSAHRPADAWRILQTIEPPKTRPAELVLTAAALSGHLQEQLSGYRSQSDTAPPADQVLAAASTVEHDRPQDAMLIKEFEYERELGGPQRSAAAYFGLAEVRLAQKRNADAGVLIKTATVAVGTPFENLPEAVRLLDRAGMKTEAADYASQWKTAEPWNREAQFAYARLKSDASLLDAIRQSGAATYSVRTSAAIELRTLKQPASGTAELDLLTHWVISPQEAEQPFFIEARLYAAQTTSNLKNRVQLLKEAIALDPALTFERIALANAALQTEQFALGMAALESCQVAGNDTKPALNETRLLAAKALVTRKRYAQAVGLYNQVLAAKDHAASRPSIEDLRNKARTQSRLASLNSARQPAVSEQLTQPRIVKPKLTSLPDPLSFE